MHRGVESGAAFDTTAVAGVMMDDGARGKNEPKPPRQRAKPTRRPATGRVRDASDDRD